MVRSPVADLVLHVAIGGDDPAIDVGDIDRADIVACAKIGEQAVAEPVNIADSDSVGGGGGEKLGDQFGVYQASGLVVLRLELIFDGHERGGCDNKDHPAKQSEFHDQRSHDSGNCVSDRRHQDPSCRRGACEMHAIQPQPELMC